MGRVGSGRAPLVFSLFFPPSSWSFFPLNTPCLLLHKDSQTSLDNNLGTLIQWNVLGLWKTTMKITPLGLTIGVLPSSTVRPTVADERFKLVVRLLRSTLSFVFFSFSFFFFSFFFSLFLPATFLFFSFFLNPKRVVQLAFLSPHLLPAVWLLHLTIG